MYEVVDNDEELAKNVLSEMCSSDSVRARGLAAVDALRLNIFVDEAVNILEKISLRADIWGFGAGMALRIWRGEFPGNTL